MENKEKIKLAELESKICEIISTEKSEKEKAILIWGILKTFKQQIITEINKTEAKIFVLKLKSVSADDFELEKLEMEMDIILLRLFEIIYEKNKFGEIIKSIPSVIWRYFEVSESV